MPPSDIDVSGAFESYRRTMQRQIDIAEIQHNRRLSRLFGLHLSEAPIAIVVCFATMQYASQQDADLLRLSMLFPLFFSLFKSPYIIDLYMTFRDFMTAQFQVRSAGDFEEGRHRLIGYMQRTWLLPVSAGGSAICFLGSLVIAWDEKAKSNSVDICLILASIMAFDVTLVGSSLMSVSHFAKVFDLLTSMQHELPLEAWTQPVPHIRNMARGNVMFNHIDSPARRSASEKRRCRLRAFRIREDDVSDTSTCCAICLSDFEVDEFASRLPCGHLYHFTCATDWLSRSSSCPMRCPDFIYVAPATPVPVWLDRRIVASSPGSSGAGPVLLGRTMAGTPADDLCALGSSVRMQDELAEFC